MKEMSARLLSVDLRNENDLVTARHRTRELAQNLGFAAQDCTRVATAVSEIARNAFRYAAGGRVAFSVEGRDFVVTISDRGPGIANLGAVLDGTYVSSTGMGMGIAGARRLVDDLTLTTSHDGTTAVLRKVIPPGKAIDGPEVSRITQRLTASIGGSPFEEMQSQNRELVQTLDELQERNTEIERLNQELGDTNRGVLALYAELDEKAESLRRASDLKTRFLSNMSHEFRTPLNSIVSITGLLDMEADGPLAPEQRKQIQYIRSSARSLIEMVNDLLDIAKIEAGKTEVRPSELRLTELFAALRGMFRPLMTGDRVTLEIEQPPDVAVRTDEAKLSQIVRNFVSNAIKYTNDGSIRVWSELCEGKLTIRVRDSGIGIPPQYLGSIFEEFVQVENPLQKKAKGTGLGLPLSKRLAQLLGGDVTVESNLGEGSLFAVTIPAELVQPAVRTTVPDGETHARVLIIDDDETSRYVLRAMLPPGCSVDEASDGPEGIMKAKESRPDIVFVDVLMPTMNGIEVVKRLRHDPSTAEIPVIIRTSKTLTAEERRTLEEEGVFSVLGKTAESVDASMEELRAILSRAQLLDE